MSGDKAFWVKCVDCGHVWIGAWYPMELKRFAEIVSSGRCPKCGATPDRLTPAKQHDGVLEEARETESAPDGRQT